MKCIINTISNTSNTGRVMSGSDKSTTATGERDGKLINVILCGFVLFQLMLNMTACDDMQADEDLTASVDDEAVDNVTQSLGQSHTGGETPEASGCPGFYTPGGDTGNGDGTEICDFAVYSTEYTDLRDRVTSLAGHIGSAGQTAVGVNAEINGNLESVGDIWLRNYAVVNGDATTRGQVHFQHGAKVNGDIAEHTVPATYSIATKTVRYGSKDVFLYRGQSQTVTPGNYDEIHAYAGSVLTLTAGVYNARKLIIESSSVELRLDTTEGQVEINVDDELQFGDRMVMTLVGGDDPNQVRFYSNYPWQVRIGTDLSFYGVLEVPRGELVVYSRNRIFGNLFAKRVTIDTDVQIKGSGCGDSCENVICDAPPVDICVDAFTVRLYETTGTCEDGECDYQYTDQDCANGCENGSCVQEQPTQCDFAVYSTEYTELSERVTTVGGNIGSAGPTVIGADATINGNLESEDSVWLRYNAVVDGDATTGGHVHFQHGATVTGDVAEHASPAQHTISSKTVTYGSRDVVVYWGRSRTLTPGNYDEIRAYAGSTLTLTAGVYNARKFIIESSNVALRLDTTQGQIEINVDDELQFGDRMVMTLVGGDDPNQVRFYTNDRGHVRIGTDASFYGVLEAPHGELVVDSQSRIFGNLFAKRISIDTDVQITGFGCDDLCENVVCEEPPADVCMDQLTARVYESTGTCDNGECDYQYTDYHCDNGCENGACLEDACEGVVCEEPPADVCVDSSTARVYKSTGTCDDGECGYEYTDYDCANGCENGACREDACENVVCDEPPADVCVNQLTARVYDSAGTCDEGVCEYQFQDYFCRFGCRNGVCNE